MARPLTPASRAPGPRSLAVAFGAALLAHAVALSWLAQLLRPPSLLNDVATPFYTRTLTPEPPAAAPSFVAEAPASLARPTAVLRPDPSSQAPQPAAPPSSPASAPPPKAETQTEPAPAPPAISEPASAPQAPTDTWPEPAFLPPAPTPASPPEPSLPATAATSEPVSEALAPASTPIDADANAAPAFLATWPSDTRLSYRLGGYYRGELHGNAQVLWQRQGTRYQAVVQLDVGILLSSRFTSQGDITAHGLRPEVYEEQVRQRRRGVRLGEDVRLNNGERVPRPADVQDAASQFVELGHRFATGRVRLVPGTQIDFWLARPGGVDEWTYDVVGEETIHLPRLGPVQAFHLKPRPIAKPRGNISAEIWFAPSLQYLPVRIRITQGNESHVDLIVETVEQQ